MMGITGDGRHGMNGAICSRLGERSWGHGICVVGVKFRSLPLTNIYLAPCNYLLLLLLLIPTATLTQPQPKKVQK
jgi:hypothetical protein